MADFLTTIDSDRGPIEPLPVTLVSQGTEVILATLLAGIASPNQTARLVSSAATTNALNLKSSATRLVGVMGYNANAEGRYLKLYNKATTPTVGTDIPALTFYLPPQRDFPPYTLGALNFPLGLGMALTAGSADADSGAVLAGDIMGLNITFT